MRDFLRNPLNQLLYQERSNNTNTLVADLFWENNQGIFFYHDSQFDSQYHLETV
jgi:hypothetical protein